MSCTGLLMGEVTTRLAIEVGWGQENSRGEYILEKRVGNEFEGIC